MTKARIHCGLLATALTVAGCATNPPLMFGDTTTYGLRLGNDTATGGGSVSLGYKAHSIAVVPVSVLDENGKAWLLKGHGEDRGADAMSVFASFESAASAPAGAPKASTVRLGQVFSTGLAAQSLTAGYLCREAGLSTCTAPEVLPSHLPVAQSVQTAATTATDRPYQAPLLFLRADSVGIDIGGSLAEQGLQFNLGYTNRNLALIPVYATAAGQKVVRVAASAGGDAEGGPADAMSVLGQFKVNTETTQLGLGLERYFATGVAARNLGNSIKAAIARIPTDNAPPAVALAATTPASAAGR